MFNFNILHTIMFHIMLVNICSVIYVIIKSIILYAIAMHRAIFIETFLNFSLNAHSVSIWS